MSKNYYSLGLMSGTSMDGGDASIIQSDGKVKYKAIFDKYFEYPKNIYKNLTTLRDKIKSSKDLKKYQKRIESIEKKITIFHAESANKILKKAKANVDFIGFHGQPIFHNAKKKITKQLGDGKLLSKLTKKKVVYDFRQNDLKNGGQGAPLTPIFHKMLTEKFKIKPVSFYNIGGIVNQTTIWEDGYLSGEDVGPGMWLIDQCVRTKFKKKYDTNGFIAKSGKVNQKILDKAVNIFFFNEYNPSIIGRSFDIKDFDDSFVNSLSLKDRVATLTEYTAQIMLRTFNLDESQKHKIVLCGGGRKNKFLINKFKKENYIFNLIDDFGIDGDFVESQAFAYLAIRSYLKLPISFPETTGCSKLCTGGVLIKNF